MRLFEDTRSREVGAARITCEPAGAGKLVVLISMKFELAQVNISGRGVDGRVRPVARVRCGT